MNNLQFNNDISISIIAIVYELFILFFYLIGLINKKGLNNFISPFILINIFILIVMFITECKINSKTKLFVISIKLILLFILLFYAKFSLINYLISVIILILYLFLSNTNKVYNCNVKVSTLVYTFIFSTFIYAFLYSYSKLTIS